MGDLDEPITCSTLAKDSPVLLIVPLPSIEDSERGSITGNSLANDTVILDRYEQSGRTEDLEEVITYRREALTLSYWPSEIVPLPPMALLTLFLPRVVISS